MTYEIIFFLLSIISKLLKSKDKLRSKASLEFRLCWTSLLKIGDSRWDFFTPSWKQQDSKQLISNVGIMDSLYFLCRFGLMLVTTVVITVATLKPSPFIYWI